VLGFCFELGHGVPANPAEAERRYQAALGQTNGRSLFALARCTQHGWAGIAAYPTRARQLYEECAASSSSEHDIARLAALYVSLCFEFGIGSAVDSAQAAMWLENFKNGFVCFDLEPNDLLQLRRNTAHPEDFRHLHAASTPCAPPVADPSVVFPAGYLLPAPPILDFFESPKGML